MTASLFMTAFLRLSTFELCHLNIGRSNEGAQDLRMSGYRAVVKPSPFGIKPTRPSFSAECATTADTSAGSGPIRQRSVNLSIAAAPTPGAPINSISKVPSARLPTQQRYPTISAGCGAGDLEL